jgi:hypothetical protein
MVRRMLVVRGVQTTDDLQALGLPMATEFAESDMVALIAEGGRGIMVKGAKETISVHFVDVDSRYQRCTAAIYRVFQEARWARKPGGETHIIGMFLFFWPVDPEHSQDVVYDAMAKLDADAVEAAAERFIASDFGQSLGNGATLSADGDRDAAGRSASDT